MMELILITGMAGAGKTCALNALEDIGYYAVDNLPLQMLHDFIIHCLGKGGRYLRAAVVVDIRSCHRYSELTETYRSLKKEMHEEVRFKMVCMEASENVITTRFRTGRRSHPLAARRFEGDINAAIRYEIEHLQPLRASADLLIDSSLTSTSQLKDQIKHLFMPHITDAMVIQVMSFGFKYGAPLETDLVFDMRCLPNPYYIEDLKTHTGKEKCVQDYVMNSPDSQAYFKKVTDLLKFLIPLYIREGRAQLVIGFGCTGGQHRSVTFAELVSAALREEGMQIITHHRDYKKDRTAQ